MTAPNPVKQLETGVFTAVETKVKSSAFAATVVSFVLSVLGYYVFKGGAVPAYLDIIVSTVVTGALTFVAGWLTKHTPR